MEMFNDEMVKVSQHQTMRVLRAVMGFRAFMAAVLFALLLQTAAAAPSRAETRAWEAAVARFQEAGGPLLWGSAEAKFVEFLTRFPNSDHYGEAVLYRARALYLQGKNDDAISLLSAESGMAGAQADQFRYWTAMAYLKKGDDAKAAENFARLAKENQSSPLRPEALFREAEAHSRLGAWQRVVEDLAEKDGPFQKFAAENPVDDRTVRGWLLLAQAQLNLKDYPGVEKTLSRVGAESWKGDFAWQRQMLVCQCKLAAGENENALAGSTNLILLAGEKPELKSRSRLLQGRALEKLGRRDEALKAYQANLNSSLPLEYRRETLLRMVELLWRQGGVGEASGLIEEFFSTNPDARGGDLETFVRGELLLQQYNQAKAATTATNSAPLLSATNLLQAAAADFQRVIQEFTNSPYKGKAELNLGWCRYEQGGVEESKALFASALAELPPSEDRAVAQFKLGDIAYRTGQHAEALRHYQAVADQTNTAAVPGASSELRSRALYQIIRTGLQSSNMPVTLEAMKKLLENHPEGGLAESSLLLVSQAQSPAESRALLTSLLERSPHSELLPQAKQALARSHELEGDWTNAIQGYQLWLKEFPTNESRAQVEFSLAWMTYRSGDETNAFNLFTNYVAVWGSNTLARSGDFPARAQYWVGDFYWGQEEYQKAEVGYKKVFENWPESPLAQTACMMAGRAAIQRQSPQEARSYFTNLTSNTRIPESLRMQALYALGDADFALAATPDTNAYKEALDVFSLIVGTYTNSPIAYLAYARMGDCYFAFAASEAGTQTNAADSNEHALLSYTNAMNNYARAMEAEDPTVRGKAEVRLGDSLVELARLIPDTSRQTGLFRSAFDHYLNVFDGVNLAAEQMPDIYWAKEAGMQAAALAEKLGDGRQAMLLYQRLVTSLPAMKASLEKKIEKIQLELKSPKS